MVKDWSNPGHCITAKRMGWKTALSLAAGSWVAIALPGPALAQTRVQQQLQQRQTPPAQPPSTQMPREVDFQQNTISPNSVTPLPAVPISGPASPAGIDRYVVYVNSDSQTALQQVRQFEPGAFRRPLNGLTVIQAGLFSDLSRAQQRSSELQAQGVAAQVATVPAGSSILPAAEGTPTSIAPASAPTTPPTMRSNVSGYMQAVSNAYFVVVPGKTQELGAITEQLLRLGADQQAVFERVTPLGPHVAVGPFNERGAAETWSIFLRDFGLDARVFFGR